MLKQLYRRDASRLSVVCLELKNIYLLTFSFFCFLFRSNSWISRCLTSRQTLPVHIFYMNCHRGPFVASQPDDHLHGRHSCPGPPSA